MSNSGAEAGPVLGMRWGELELVEVRVKGPPEAFITYHSVFVRGRTSLRRSTIIAFVIAVVFGGMSMRARGTLGP